MNYYIQGNKEKADQIKAAFEKLGVASNASRYNYKNDYMLYFSAGGMMDMIDANGSWANIIKTHPDYKELELPVEPKFKVGDNIKTGNQIETIAEIDNFSQRYYCESGRTIYFANQDLWHLVPKHHYDISNFYAGMPVLVRNSDNNDWDYVTFSHLNRYSLFIFRACGDGYKQCIPFEGNEHLLGTNELCDEQYINW